MTILPPNLPDPNLASYKTQSRPEVVPFIPPDARRVLDVGCSAGLFGAELKRRLGCEVWGVEPDPESAANAETVLDRVCCAGFDEALGLPEAYFDVVVFNDSLEHFPYTEPPLAYARQVLTEHGIVVCSLPNVRYAVHLKELLLDLDWRYADSGILDRTHLRFFTKKSMRRTFEQSGYSVERIEGINPYRRFRWAMWPLELIFGRYVEDTRWMQFVVVARSTGMSAG